MKFLVLKSSFLLFFIILGKNAYACNVSPAFASSTYHTCGLPTIVKAYNNSTGSQKNSSKYWWKINSVKVSDTIIGKDSIEFHLRKTGTHSIRLFVKDSAGCIDSSAATSVAVSTNAKTILDQNMNYTLNPVWMNCLQFINDPDSFRLNIESADTLKNLRIFWGDGSSDLSGGNLMPNTKKSHLYNSIGIFQVKIVTVNNGCTDTVYGMVYNQRQPTAGIVGPQSGSNRGCVPHTLRIVNNSYNISNNTFFTVDWGNGDIQTLPYTAYNDTLFHTYRKGVCQGVIKMTATNVCGSSFTTWNPIDISDKDKAKWTVSTTCDPTKDFVFQNVSEDKYCLLPDVKEYFWDFGDGSTFGWTTSKSAQYHKYKNPGDYIVSLIVKTACGNDTFKSKVQVYYMPAAYFSHNTNGGCKPLSVTVTDTSKGRGYTRLWTVKEGSTTVTSTDSVFTYTFTVAGTHSISLKVSNPCGSSTLSKNFKVNDKPTAGFANISGTCVPVTVNFSNTSTSWFSNPSYTWDFGDGTGSNVKNPAARVYSTPGNYTVRLIVSDSCGNDTFSQVFTAYGLPKAVISGDTTSCTFDSLRFNNQSVNANSYNWSFGDAQTLNTNTAGFTKHMYSATGYYTVRLIAGTGAGCKDTAFRTVFIKPGAKAQFDINRAYGCNPVTFKFTNTSIYGKDFRWYANGRLISTATVTADTTLYSDTTVIRMKLIATSASSCQGDSIEKVFFTTKNPKAIIGNLDSGCGKITVQFNNLSSNATAFNWNLGNGSVSSQKNPQAVYAAAAGKDTLYYPELKVSNWAGCKDSVKSVVKVFPGPSALFDMSTDKGCGPLQVAFNNKSRTNNGEAYASLSHQWNFGDGSASASADPDHSFASGVRMDSVYTVSLKVSSIKGCTDSISKSVRVYPKPLIRFAADKTSGCAILPVNFGNNSLPGDTGSISIMTFAWNSGNGKTAFTRNFNASYNNSLFGDTTYRVMLTGSSEHGCKDSAVMNITVHPQPVAAFGLNAISGCTPLHISTLNQSVSKDGGALGHVWNFGNGFQSVSREDSTVYINSGNSDVSYTISYQAISQYGCKDTAVKQVTVKPKPVASFTLSTKKACAPLKLTVTDNSVNAASYFWGEGSRQFTGASAETLILNGKRLFDSLYIISHQVTSPFGCLSDTVYQQVLVLGRPDAGFEFSADSVCSRENIGMVNTSLGGYQYLWKFGDGKTSTQVNPKHNYPKLPSNGRDTVFKVSLEVRSVAACRDTAFRSIHLVNKPNDKIVLDKTYGCTDLEVNLEHKSASGFKTLYWDFGDNTPVETGDAVQHTFVNPMGNLTMQPKVQLFRQKFNCRDTASAFLLVYPKPTADFKAQRNDPCDAGNYQFINKSKNNTSNQWSIDEQNISSVSSFTALLQPSRQKDTFYNVKLYVKNNYQCTDSIKQVLRVKPKMGILFEYSPSIACEKGVVNFTNKSSNAVRFFWMFGDGGLSNEMHPSYVYNRYGSYKVTLYGYDRDGCVDSSDKATFIKVLEKPVADFYFLPSNPKLPNAVVNFTSDPKVNSVNVNDLSYEWNFGDNSFPTLNKNEKHPVHTYTTSGNREVTLIVRNKECSDVISKPIYIEDPKPEISFSADTTEGCAALRVQFRNNTRHATSYRWVWGDGTPDSYEKEPVHVFKYAGNWDVTLIATGTGGTSTEVKQYMIKVLPRPDADFFTNKRFLNLPNAIFSMQNISNNAIRYDWYLYDSFNNVIEKTNMRDPSFYVNETGSFSVKLVAWNSYGCSDTLLKKDYLTTYKEGYVYIPSAFSPNKNGRNDGFKASTYNVKPDNFRFAIYNRWGEKVFETTDLSEEWDGTLNGENCEQDVYLWTVNGEYINNDQFAFRGTVTLLR